MVVKCAPRYGQKAAMPPNGLAALTARSWGRQDMNAIHSQIHLTIVDRPFNRKKASLDLDPSYLSDQNFPSIADRLLLH